MGGDYAPQAVVSGAVLAAGLIAPQSKIVLFGDRPSIEELLAKENFRADAFDIVHTTQVIEMGDNPALTFRQKPDSSIAVGFRHLTEGRIDGFASAGSTGAMMVGCMYTVKQIEGIIRPAISSVIPTIDGGSVMLLDVGLNVDCKPEVLYQYAVIGNLDIEFRYEEIEDEEREVTINEGQSNERKVFVSVVPPSPLEGLLQQERRYREICYEHITTDMKRVFLDVKVANKPLQKEEQQMFYYAVMQRVMSDSKLRQCGFRPKEGSYLTDEEQFAAAGRITAKQQAALIRAFLVDYFRSAAPEYRCTDETLLTGMMCRFADMNFTEQSQKVQQEYLKVYERRKARLQEQIDALQAKAEAEEMAVSMQEAPDAEPEMPELLPDETPAIEPTPEPLIIPMDPDIEPDTRMPEEMKTAA